MEIKGRARKLLFQIHHMKKYGEQQRISCPHCKKNLLVLAQQLDIDEDTIHITIKREGK